MLPTKLDMKKQVLTFCVRGIWRVQYSIGDEWRVYTQRLTELVNGYGYIYIYILFLLYKALHKFIQITTIAFSIVVISGALLIRLYIIINKT